MLIRKSQLLLVLLLCLVVPITAFAKPADAMAQGEKNGNTDINELTTFSLDSCIELALENNIKLKIEAEDYEKAKIERSEAKSASDRIEKIRDDKILREFVPQAFTFEGAQVKDLVPKLKTAEELIAKKNLDLSKQNLRIEVEKAYYNVLKAEDNLKNAEVQLERSKLQLKNAEVSFKHGVVAKDSVLGAQLGLANSETNLVSAKNKLNLTKMNLNKTMGRKLDAPIELTTKFVYNPTEIPDVESMVESALKLRPEVISVREMKDVTELNCKLALKYYAENTYIYKKAVIDFNKAVLGVKEAEDSIGLAVRAAHLSTSEAMEQLKAAEKKKQYAAEVYRIADLKYKSQVATMTEVLEALETLNKAELAYTAAVFDYNVAKAELDNWAGKGLE